MSAIRREEIRRRLDAGENQSQIATDFGISRQRVWQILNQKEPAPRPAASCEPGSKPNWRFMVSEERDRLLREYCAKGFSAGQITGKFTNASRSAVIGRVYRLKLQLKGGDARKGKTGRPKKDAPPRIKAAKPPVKKPSARTAEATSWRGPNNPHYNDIKSRAEQRAASPGLPAHLVAGEARKPIDTLGVPTYRNLKLVELTERTCKWPLGDPQAENFAFCGNDAAHTGPYCKYHARIAFNPAPARPRPDASSARKDQ